MPRFKEELIQLVIKWCFAYRDNADKDVMSHLWEAFWTIFDKMHLEDLSCFMEIAHIAMNTIDSQMWECFLHNFWSSYERRAKQ